MTEGDGFTCGRRPTGDVVILQRGKFGNFINVYFIIYIFNYFSNIYIFSKKLRVRITKLSLTIFIPYYIAK